MVNSFSSIFLISLASISLAFDKALATIAKNLDRQIKKEKITQANKSISDYDDGEMEGLIGDEEKNLNYDQLKTMLIAVLAVEGLSNLI